MADAFGGIEDETATYDRLTALIRSRRTSMLVDPVREVPADVVSELCGLATWAPNHKKTWPWRFAYFTGEGRRRLGEEMVVDMIADDVGDEGKRVKTLTKYLRTPGILVVGCAPHDNEMLHIENRDAVAAGIQNLLLGATALGIATFWSTPAITRPRHVLQLCRFDQVDRIVGIVYVGYATGTVGAPERPEIPITHVDS